MSASPVGEALSRCRGLEDVPGFSRYWWGSRGDKNVAWRGAAHPALIRIDKRRGVWKRPRGRVQRQVVSGEANRVGDGLRERRFPEKFLLVKGVERVQCVFSSVFDSGSVSARATGAAARTRTRTRTRRTR